MPHFWHHFFYEGRSPAVFFYQGRKAFSDFQNDRKSEGIFVAGATDHRMTFDIGGASAAHCPCGGFHSGLFGFIPACCPNGPQKKSKDDENRAWKTWDKSHQ